MTTVNTFFLIIGKYYLVDSGYANRPGYQALYRGTNYHVHDQRQVGGDRKKKMFNYHHISLHKAVERTFGLWRNRFHILIGVPQYLVQNKEI